MSAYTELRQILTYLLTQRFAPKPEYIKGLLGTGKGQVEVPGKPDFSYFRPARSSEQSFEVFNKLCPKIDGLPVLVGELSWHPGLTQVISIDWQVYLDVGWGSSFASTSAHGESHQWRDGWRGSDTFNIYRRQIAPMRVYPAGSGSQSVYMSAYDYIYEGEPKSWQGLPGLDLTNAAPATGTARLMLVYLDMAENEIGAISGTVDIYSDAIQLPRPTLPTATWTPSAYVRLYGGQGTIHEEDIFDARQLFATIPDTSGGWPFPTQSYTVDPESDDADFTTLADALAASPAKNLVYLGAQTFQYDGGGAALPDGVNIKGLDKGSTTIVSTGTNELMRLGDGGYLEDFTATKIHGYTSTLYGIRAMSGVGGTLRNLNVNISNISTGGAFGIDIDDQASIVRLYDLEVTARGSGSTGGRAIQTQSGPTGPVVYVWRGWYDGDAYDIDLGSNTSLFLWGPILKNRTMDIPTGSYVAGYWQDHFGNRYQTRGRSNLDDGETHTSWGPLWGRMINRPEMTMPHWHRTADGAKPMPDWITNPAVRYINHDAAYTSIFRDTWYRMRSSSVSLRCFLGFDQAVPIRAATSLYGRLCSTSGTEVALGCDNWISGYGYGVGDRWYYYEIYLIGVPPVLQVGYRHGYYTWSGAVWNGPTETTGGPTSVFALGESMVVRLYLNYGGSASTVAGYIVGENGVSSSFGSVAMYLDAAVTPAGATRAGLIGRLQGFAGAGPDWVRASWVY